MSKYKSKQVDELNRIVTENDFGMPVYSVGERIYNYGFRKLNIRFLTLHVLLSTWHWFFAGCFVFFLVGLFFFREEFAMNHWFILWIGIPVAAIVAMTIDSYKHAKKIWTRSKPK